MNISINFKSQTIHPFYDVTVKDIHQFYANGILVHNKMVNDPDNIP